MFGWAFSWIIGEPPDIPFLQDQFLIIYFFTGAALARKGIANNREITVRALAYVIAGHERHHVGILRDRYRV